MAQHAEPRAFTGEPRVTTPHGGDAVEPPCAYIDCALRVAPRWNGLAVVRGDSGSTAANLGFFWATDVTAVFKATTAHSPALDSAVTAARQAVRLRRVAAALTDGGALLMMAGIAHALFRGRLGRADDAIAGTGAALFVTSVPLQFAADGALSRAVWWYDAQFGR